jgi:ferredoxin
LVTVSIDREECISCGVCWETCPEIFEESPDDQFSRIVEPYRVGGDVARGEVPDTLERCAQDAADTCPVEIIDVQAS